MKTPIDIIYERRKFLRENSIKEWNDIDTIFVMEKYLNEVLYKSKNLKHCFVRSKGKLSKSKIKNKVRNGTNSIKAKCICKTVKEAEECEKQCGTMGQ